jgi:hypothetical protein
MKKISLIIVMVALVALTSCTTHSVKFTTIAQDNTYEKSFVWVVKKETEQAFDKKINKENCSKIEGNI